MELSGKTVQRAPRQERAWSVQGLTETPLRLEQKEQDREDLEMGGDL